MQSLNRQTVGIAPIKTEFLLLDHVRELNMDFVAAKDKKRVEENDLQSEGPPRKKLKGQNKRRPRNQRTPKSDKLCFKIGSEGSCPFGDSCCYSHDVETYLSKKPPDLGSTCYLFQKYGKCPYSYSCRYGSDHIKDGKNVVKDEVWEKFKDLNNFSSMLTKNLQKSLRNRQYDFKKSNKIISGFQGTVSFNKFRGQNDSNSINESLTKPSQLDKTDIEQKVEVKVNLSENDSPSSLTENLAINLKSEKDIHSSLSKECNVKSKTNDLSNSSEEINALTKPAELEMSSTCEKSATNGRNRFGCDLNQNSDDRDPTTDFPAKTLLKESTAVNLLLESKSQKVDFKNKLYLAPLTTVGNLPFRRICKTFGADITCSEMAVGLSLLQGQQSEWALIKRHHTEDIFGIQLCGAHPDAMTRCCQLLEENASFDFIDINLGCPLDNIYKRGAGCGLMNRMKKLEGIVYGVSSVIDKPLTLKMRTGIKASENIAHRVIEEVKQWKGAVSLITLHGRSREQRYTKSADWQYIDQCNKIADPIPLFGNGDILSYEDYNTRCTQTGVSGVMIARGALIKPWIFKEIKEQMHWDISSSERLDILRNYSNYGLEHWGSDSEGVEKTRRFLLEWLSFLYRYIPVGLLERLPQRINERPSPYFGRNDLETLMASPSCSDWIKISEMLLGPVPENFVFLPKHKANAYQ